VTRLFLCKLVYLTAKKQEKTSSFTKIGPREKPEFWRPRKLVHAKINPLKVVRLEKVPLKVVRLEKVPIDRH